MLNNKHAGEIIPDFLPEGGGKWTFFAILGTIALVGIAVCRLLAGAARSETRSRLQVHRP